MVGDGREASLLRWHLPSHLKRQKNMETEESEGAETLRKSVYPAEGTRQPL